MFEILPESHDSRIALKASGKLTHADYQKLTALLEQRIAQSGPLSALMDMADLTGMELRAAWDDFVLGITHRGDFERIAVVGNRKWEEIVTEIADRLMKSDIRYFDVSQRDAAWAWIEA